MRLKEFKKLNENPRKIEVGEFFLTKGLLTQKETIKRGDVITYYVIIEVKKNGNYEFMPIYEKIE